MKFMTIDTSKIVSEDRARQLNAGWVEILASDIKENGCIHPPVVWIDAAHDFRLVAGNHRFAALKLNGDKRITVGVSEAKNLTEAKILEVKENLFRNELTALDRCRHLFELVSNLEKENPDLKRGGNAQVTGEKDRTAILAIRSDTADQIGLSDRVIRRDVAIWKGLTPASRADAQMTWLADHQAGLQQLSQQTGPVQKKICALLFSTPPKATNVGEAITLLSDGRLATDTEKKFNSTLSAVSALKPKEREQVFLAHETEILAWVAKRTKD